MATEIRSNENPNSTWETIKWLFYTLVGSLLPIWGSCLLLHLSSQNIQWPDFFRHGEFAIYSAALVTPSLYLIFKENFRIWKFKRHFFGFIGLICLISASLIFAGVTVSRINSSIPTSFILDEKFLVISSLVVFLFSIILAFFVTLADNIRTAQDFYAIGQQSVIKLEKDFDALGDKNV